LPVAGAAVALIVALSLPAAAVERSHLDYFARLEDAPLVVDARVERARAIPEVRLVVYRFVAVEVLKGRLAAGPPEIVQELVFKSDDPLLAEGQRAVLLLEPFPVASRYRAQLPSGPYLRVAGGRDGVRGAAALAASRAYAQLLARGADQRIQERMLFFATYVRDGDLGDDALAALRRFLERKVSFGKPCAEALSLALADSRVPLERRRGILEVVGAYNLAGMDDAVRRALADPDLAPFARRALAALGKTPAEELVRRDLSAPDPAVRLAALDSVTALAPQERIDLLTEVARNDRDLDVRLHAIDLLGENGAPAVPSLSTLLDGSDRQICYHAALGLASIGTDGAVRVLADQFERGTYEAQVAAVFALHRVATPEALRTLARVRKNPPDPRLVKVIDLTTGRKVEP